MEFINFEYRVMETDTIKNLNRNQRQGPYYIEFVLKNNSITTWPYPSEELRNKEYLQLAECMK